MILNTGNRTDIPAFFFEWFYQRIREGFVCVRNPFDATQVTRYELSPEVVDCLVFCTKNPAPMLPRIAELSAYPQYWFVTITAYGTDIEPRVPDKFEVIESVKRLSEAVGAGNLCWRYDPILIDETYTVEAHMDTFRRMAEKLSGYVSTCVVSFIDLYEKTLKNFPGVRAVTEEEENRIGEAFGAIGKEYRFRMKTCAEGTRLKRYGFDCEGCLTERTIEETIGCPVFPQKNKMSRAACSCILGNDIGAYNTCAHGCRYCYANYDERSVRENRRRHDPHSPFLIGGPEPYDRVTQADQKSIRDPQLRLF